MIRVTAKLAVSMSHARSSRTRTQAAELETKQEKLIAIASTVGTVGRAFSQDQLRT